MAYTDIDKPSDYFNTKLYTGTGSSQSITGVGFQPDLTWVKSRSVTSTHKLMDIVRGNGNTLATNNTNAEASDSSIFPSLDSDGFTVDGNTNSTNASGQTYVGWNWLCNTSISQGVGNDATATVKANLDTNMAIATYTGDGDTTSSRPLIDCGGILIDLIIYKRLDSTSNWCVQSRYGTTSSTAYHFRLNTTDAQINGTGTIGNFGFSGIRPRYTNANDGNNINSANYVAYVFGSKKGFSKFGTYTGNGSTDGTFVYTGFKPAFVIVKLTSSSGENWYMQDATRDPFNPSGRRIKGNGSDAESNNSAFNIDFLSSGMKMRNTNGGHNGSGSTYIYMAFAENPFTTSTGIPTTAR